MEAKLPDLLQPPQRTPTMAQRIGAERLEAPVLHSWSFMSFSGLKHLHKFSETEHAACWSSEFREYPHHWPPISLPRAESF